MDLTMCWGQSRCFKDFQFSEPGASATISQNASSTICPSQEETQW